jgi:hypothetical protein
MKVAMEKLEERFTRTMKEVAVLSDEKQRLEHLVLQLQGETETIGKICFLRSFCMWLLGNILLLNFLKLNVIVIVSTSVFSYPRDWLYWQGFGIFFSPPLPRGKLWITIF